MELQLEGKYAHRDCKLTISVTMEIDGIAVLFAIEGGI
jgi:hypothetical protein